MMRFLSQNHSAYPLEGGAAPAHLIAEQEAAGCDIVTDGQARHRDAFDVVAGLEGIRLVASPTTPQHVQVVGEIQRVRPLVLEDYREASRLTQRPVKAVLPGPYSLARRADRAAGPYQSLASLGQALSLALTAEIDDLTAAGARFIQFDEPEILQHPEDIRLLRQLFEPLWAARRDAQIIVSTYLADATPLYAQLSSIPADILAVDLVCGPGLYDLIRATGASKVLALGVVDGRASTFGSAEQIAKLVAPLLKRYEFEEIYLLPSCSLRSTTPAAARAALQQLHGACSVLQSGGRGR